MCYDYLDQAKYNMIFLNSVHKILFISCNNNDSGNMGKEINQRKYKEEILLQDVVAQ